MNTLLADPPALQSPEQPTASSTPAAPPEGGAGGTEAPPPAHAHVCAHCGTPLQEGQQWCLHCGACEPGSLGERPNLRPLTVLALTAAILALGAAVAVAAAINEHSAPRAATVALVPATTPATVVPTTPTTPAPTATTPAAGGTTSPHSSSKGSNLLFPPSSTTKPPKVASPTSTPKASGESNPSESNGSGTGSTTTPSKATTTTETGTSTTESKSKEGSSGKSEQPTPILLDTNAATTYNPYNYPESGFGDPALAIDGEPTTAWTAQVQPHSFPSMAEGLLIDLREPTKLGSIELRTPTPGMTVQIYGANGAKAPTTITEPGWVLLSGSHTLKKKVTHLKKLRTEGQSFRWVVVWLVKAPASAQGTPTAPGHVALSEVALYPPASS
ncbi:MAG TPA: zinc ribbon domain-containing protein [Solirubrobacteraceae bacterium]|nr:zinc ribbon domain-containing protein [Solirubrobacteraceae bacterium]